MSCRVNTFWPNFSAMLRDIQRIYKNKLTQVIDQIEPSDDFVFIYFQSNIFFPIIKNYHFTLISLLVWLNWWTILYFRQNKGWLRNKNMLWTCQKLFPVPVNEFLIVKASINSKARKAPAKSALGSCHLLIALERKCQKLIESIREILVDPRIKSLRFRLPVSPFSAG